MAEVKTPAPIHAQVQKIGVDSKGVLKVEVGIPLHVALKHAEDLLALYGQNIEIVIPR